MNYLVQLKLKLEEYFQVHADRLLPLDKFHLRRFSFHYAVTHVRNKNINIQGRSPNVVKVIIHIIGNCS